MDTPKSDLIQQSSSTVSAFSDWDIDFTEEELQSIEAIFQSATSSSSSSRKQPVADCDGDRPKTRRRLPDSLFNFTEQSTFSSHNASSSSSLLPCPRNRFRSCHRVRKNCRYC
ncbi:hypothetical protein HanOQP8_Chr01g0027451 [Helianthus annuus]|nr:hypothetical protein HanOQP8_Chr01g0027451 [Helianthus annuus]